MGGSMVTPTSDGPTSILQRCREIFTSLEYLSRLEPDIRKLRRLQFIDENKGAFLVNVLQSHESSLAERIAAAAAISAMGFGVTDEKRLNRLYNQQCVVALNHNFSSTNSMELRTWCIIAICDLNANASYGLQHTWDCGAVHNAFTWLAMYVSTKDLAIKEHVIKKLPIKNFTETPCYEIPLVNVASEDLTAPTQHAVSSEILQESNLHPETQLMAKSMSPGPHRIAMYILGLFVMFSRNQDFMPLLHSISLESCDAYKSYRVWLMKHYGDCTADAVITNNITSEPAHRSEDDVVGGDWYRPRLLKHILFTPSCCPTDIVLHVVESNDEMYAHIAASVTAYMIGADETGHISADAADGITVMDMEKGATDQPCEVRRARQTVHAGIPSAVIQMLLDAACAGVNNELYKGFSAYLKVWTYMQPLSVIAIADVNKSRICSLGGIAVAVKALSHPDDKTKQVTTQLLWLLAFHDRAKELIMADGRALPLLREIAHSSEVSSATRTNALGTLWQLNAAKQAHGITEDVNTKIYGDDEEKDGVQHIMLSYQWDDQALVVMVRKYLEESGYKVWMDVEKMEGSVLECMADAVEGAQWIIMFVSSRYRASACCRSEAEYAYKLRKPIIPVMTQENYSPEGWLGILLGTKLYYSLHGVAQCTKTIYTNCKLPESVYDLKAYSHHEEVTQFEMKMGSIIKQISGPAVAGKKNITQHNGNGVEQVAAISHNGRKEPHTDSSNHTGQKSNSTHNHNGDNSVIFDFQDEEYMNNLSKLSTAEIQEWVLNVTKNIATSKEFMKQDIDGNALLELRSILLSDENLFHSMLKDDLHIKSLGTRLSISRALRHLSGILQK